MGLDMEMAFKEHYHEVLHTICKMFVYIFNGLKKRYGEHLNTVNQQYPFEDFQYPQETLILEFPEAVSLLRENGHEVGDFEDFSTEMEKTLGKLVKEKYKTDFYVLDKFPLAVRPFYTMPDPKKPVYLC
jgi:aspartyl-tRNA synthetase